MKFKRNYFYILLVAVAVGYFYLVFTNYDENKQQTYNSAVSSQIKTVQKYKAIINERIEQQKRLLEETAKFIETKDYIKDYATIKGVLSIVARTGSFLAVYAGYPDSYRFVASNDIEPQYNFSDRPWFVAAKESMTEPYIDRQLGIYVISVSTPLLKNGKFIGVLTADLDFEIFQKELAALFPLANGSAFLMVDGKNILDQTEQILDFSDAQTKEILQKISVKKQGNEKILIKNKPYIFVYDTLANSKWMLVSVLDEGMIYRQIDKKALKDLGIFLALAFLAFVPLLLFMWRSENFIKTSIF